MQNIWKDVFRSFLNRNKIRCRRYSAFCTAHKAILNSICPTVIWHPGRPDWPTGCITSDQITPTKKQPALGSLSGQEQSFSYNSRHPSGWADTWYRHRSSTHSSPQEAVSGSHHSLCSRRKTDRHLWAFPLSRNDHNPGR